MLFVVSEGSQGTKLWRSDGSLAGTEPVFDLAAGFGGVSVADVVLHEGSAWLSLSLPSTGISLWRSDGTSAGTVLAADPAPGANDFGIGELTSFAGDVWFVTSDGTTGRELWRTDDSPVGAHLVVDLDASAVQANSSPDQLTVVGDGLYFVANEPTFGLEVWRADAFEQVQPVVDLASGSAGSSPRDLLAFGGLLLFTAEAVSGQRELYASDGTTSGTVQLTNFAASTFTSTIGYPTAAGERGFFLARDEANDVTLWATDGTPTGTTLVADELLPGEDLAFFPLFPVGSATRVVFNGATIAAGNEPWTIDASAQVPELVLDLRPGPASSSSGKWTRRGDRILVAADDGSVGQEPHALSIADLGGYVLEPYGSGCGDAHIGSSGQARIGQSFDVELDALALTTAGLYLASDPAFVSLAPGCQALIGNPLSLGITTTDAAGKASKSLTVGSQPSLVGAHVFLQWASFSLGGPLAGLIELSDGLEVVVGP